MRSVAKLLQHSRRRGDRVYVPRRSYPKMTDGEGLQSIEEQSLFRYPQKRYYPVRIGDLFKNQYRIITKLGYGAYSTVWLARDERSKQYASLKVCVQDNTETSPVINEVSMLQRLGKVAQGSGNPDISPQNVLMEVEGDTIFEEIEKQESHDPSVPIMSAGAPIYRSRTPMLELSGIPILSDFGQMRLREPVNKDLWMSDLYRAPEVLLGLPWDFPVDIWCLGVMTLELLEGKNLFDPVDRVTNEYVLPLALAQYIGYLGPPPLDMIKQSPLFLEYFDHEGNWIFEPQITKTSFEDFVTTIPPGEDKDMFLRFIRTVLTWDPVLRATSSEAIRDEWLMKPWDNNMW
ncbi:MAG: hypothetical protein Q9163_005354 [Psora crenata]